MSGLILTGAIPGLILPGATVTWGHFLGVVVATGPDLSRGPACAEVWVDWTARRLPLSDLALHMGEAGRDRCVRWLRERGHDLRWAEDEPEVLAWSVLSVHRGGRPILDALSPWDLSYRCRWDRGGVAYVSACEADDEEDWAELGWRFGPRGSVRASGLENGPDGRAAADRAALAAGYALRNDDGTLTLPELPKENA